MVETTESRDAEVARIIAALPPQFRDPDGGLHVDDPRDIPMFAAKLLASLRSTSRDSEPPATTPGFGHEATMTSDRDSELANPVDRALVEDLGERLLRIAEQVAEQSTSEYLTRDERRQLFEAAVGIRNVGLRLAGLVRKSQGVGG